MERVVGDTMLGRELEMSTERFQVRVARFALLVSWKNENGASPGHARETLERAVGTATVLRIPLDAER